VIVGETCIFDGGDSYDPDGTIIYYEWDFNDGTIVNGTLNPTHAYTYPDIYTVTLTVIDDDGDIGTASLEIVVKSPAEATEDLIDDIEEMDLPPDFENSLIQKLNNAIQSFENGQPNAAMHKLNAFINQVEAQRGKKITNEQADLLVNNAQQIIDVLLSTSKTKTINKPFLTFLENHPHLFPLLRQILGLK
jgi:PKD repeat protein